MNSHPMGVLALADVFDQQRAPLEQLAGRLRQVAAQADTGASDLDGQTRAAAGIADRAIVLIGQIFEAMTDELDEDVRKFVSTNDTVAAQMRVMHAKLPES